MRPPNSKAPLGWRGAKNTSAATDNADYTPLADLVGQNIAGQTAASYLLADLANSFEGDLLYERLKLILATGEIERVRAFCRTLQKKLECMP